MEGILQQIHTQGVIPVFSVENTDELEGLLQVFQRVGVKCLEVTFRSPKTPKIFEYLNEHYPEIAYGAGTVRNLDQLEIAIRCQVKFVVSPGFSPKIAEQLAHQRMVPYLPGVDSTLGIEQASSFGLSHLKFFPATAAGGIAYLRALRGPYPDIQFLPTGGISSENYEDYLRLPNVFAVGGSFLTPKALIQRQKWQEIEQICSQTLEKVQTIRNSD